MPGPIKSSQSVYCEERPKGGIRGIPEDEAALKACIASISPSTTTRRWIIYQKQDSEREQAVSNVANDARSAMNDDRNAGDAVAVNSTALGQPQRRSQSIDDDNVIKTPFQDCSRFHQTVPRSIIITLRPL
ncbi:exo-beta-D-glucosaminidase [Aspergillus udagawae]|uniref:Exo-beta-D-glucosaminidase n=1 Tax=Aspergillus udagawae TaxID=91492 RepID=A0A8H3NMD2_9EURO|nr:exo-beta-D-glucosaminidase [Aspergillus udagawae]